MSKNYCDGICPACESDNVHYPKNGIEHIFEIDNVVIKAICDDCKTCFNEIYKLEFLKSEITGKTIPEEE